MIRFMLYFGDGGNDNRNDVSIKYFEEIFWIVQVVSELINWNHARRSNV